MADVRQLSDELAGDPNSVAFLALGEALRMRGELDAADRVAQRGRERHPGMAAAHDLAARIALDRGDSPAAREAWQAVLKLDTAHTGAHKGLGFVAYRDGRLREAYDHLSRAAAADPGDASIVAALETVQVALRDNTAAPPAVTPTPRASMSVVSAAPRRSIGASLFADVGSPEDTMLLVDRSGLVLAGSAPVGGVDQSAEIGAHLSGISEEADRAMRHLDLGAWTMILIEAPGMSGALSPMDDGALVMVAAPHSTPLGLLRRMLGRAAERGRTWLAES